MATDTNYALIRQDADGSTKVIRTYLSRSRAEQDADLLNAETDSKRYSVSDVEFIDA